jgi:hypothetical protein
MRSSLSEYLINVALVFVSTDPFALPVWRLGVETTTARYTWLARKTRHSRTAITRFSVALARFSTTSTLYIAVKVRYLHEISREGFFFS